MRTTCCGAEFVQVVQSGLRQGQTLDRMPEFPLDFIGSVPTNEYDSHWYVGMDEDGKQVVVTHFQYRNGRQSFRKYPRS